MGKFTRTAVTIGACVACFMGGRAVQRDTDVEEATACAFTMATLGATLADATSACRTPLK